jgi:3-hydroxy-3-methylglutaryl CoA synthase
MPQIEELEMDAHRAQLNSDVRHLVDKYRAIFGWDVPEVDEALSQRLIVKAIRQVLDELERKDVPTIRA